MLIGQITDIHVTHKGAIAYNGKIATNGMLDNAIAHINKLNPPPEFVICTGDLVATGKESEYRNLKIILERLRVPLLVSAGNHDNRENLRNILRYEYLDNAANFINYVIVRNGIRIIVLDSAAQGHHHGEFCAVRLQWLADRLAEEPEMPTIVAMHHPPFVTGIPSMDGPGSKWAEELLLLLGRYRNNILRVICGHVHRAIFTVAKGLPVSVCPSTAQQVGLDLDRMPDPSFGPPPVFVMEPPAFQLHRWDGRTLTTHTAYIGTYALIDRRPE